MSADRVKVAIRIRNNSKPNLESYVIKTPEQPQVILGAGNCQKKKMTFDFVFTPEDTLKQLYKNAVQPMVMQLFNGYNVTIIAYGETNSGKTYTMGNEAKDKEMGVIPRAIEDIFYKIEKLSENNFTVRFSFIELYQNQIIDVLTPNKSTVNVREFAIPNLTEIPVETADQMVKYFNDLAKERKIGKTAMNAESSRSHAILSITLRKVPNDDPSAETIVKLNLVDLAGTEKQKKAKTNGKQLDEAAANNLSITELNRAITVLAQNTEAHVPHRSGILSCLLHDSWLVNSKTLMVACVSPRVKICKIT